MKSKHFENIINDTKASIVRSINAVVNPLLLPELDYVELPHRIRLTDSLGEELDDYIIAVREDEAIINTMFNDSTPKLISLKVETLIEILRQVERYSNENV